MIQNLQLAQNFYATVTIEPVPLKKLVGLAHLVDQTNTIKLAETSIKLTTEPVIFRTLDGQLEVINAHQVLMGADTTRLHSQSRIFVSRLMEEADLPMARLYFQILEPARQFGDIDPLIRAAYSNSHATALLRQHVLKQPVDRPITTQQLEQLCGGRVRKSTINERKKALGFTQPGRGCKAKHVSDDTNDACPV